MANGLKLPLRVKVKLTIKVKIHSSLPRSHFEKFQFFKNAGYFVLIYIDLVNEAIEVTLYSMNYS